MNGAEGFFTAGRTVAAALVILGCLAGCGSDDDESSDRPTARGISKALAEIRASLVEDVKYDLFLALDRGAEETERATCTLSFRLREQPEDLIVDYGAGTVQTLSVNGEKIADPKLIENHIVVPGGLLKKGLNEIKTSFRSPVGKGGTALTRFEDETDGTEYVYTLLVPADAHLLFPCFDQPDIKARLTLKLELPAEWKALSNAPIAESIEKEGRKTVTFAQTAPISTYLMAFTAGDYVRIDDEEAADGARPMALYVRPAKRDKLVPADLFRLSGEALRWLEEYFGVDYPFEQFAFALVPGFPYGGMEHPGAIFYSEQASVFDQEPTASQLLRRAILYYHEVSHQWFGDLVTMAWFDDLWLKEGFATFMSYRIMDALYPEKQAWMRFHQRVKPRAYRVDATAGTTPVYQELGNLYDAKSAYGAIVYNKAPALLQQLEFLIGDEAFRKGTQLCLERFAFGNARWPEIFECYEDASGRDLEEWLEAWLLTKGMPSVTAEWDVDDDDRIAEFEVVQEPVGGGGMEWPIKCEVALWYPGGTMKRVPVEFDTSSHDLDSLEGKKAPEFVFVNFEDRAYGQFTLDGRSVDTVTALLPLVKDDFLRTLLLSALWDMVRAAALAPLDYIDLALGELGRETDPVTYEILLGRVTYALEYYLGDRQQPEAFERVEKFLLETVTADATPKLIRLCAFRAIVGAARTENTLDWLKKILAEEIELEEIDVASRDRWKIVGRLARLGADDSLALFEAEKERGGTDARRYAFEQKAGFNDPNVKQAYFDAYFTETEWPEQWLESSLGAFNSPTQSEITMPFLLPALERLEWVKNHRKIFFMPRWIAAFISGHRSRKALKVVTAFLEETDTLPGDIRLKILQSVDSLERTVRIRERFGR